MQSFRRSDRVTILSIAILLSCGAAVLAQSAFPDQALSDQSLCFRGQVTVLHLALPGGFSLRISGREQEQDCNVALRSPTGEDARPFNDAIVSMSGATGEDVTGDGIPDLVLEGLGGGSGNYSTVMIYSLEAHPRVLFASDVFGGHQRELPPELPQNRIMGIGNGLRFVRNRRDRRITVVASDEYDLFDNLPRGEWIAVDVPFELLKGSAVVVDPDVADFDDEIVQSRLKIKPQALDKFLMSDPERDDDLKRDSEYWETKRAALQIALDYIYSGRPQMAWSALDDMWPAPDRSRIRAVILDRYCKESIPKSLGFPLGPECDSPRQ